MFPKNAAVFTFVEDTDLSQLETQLSKQQFLPCTDLQPLSQGWAPVTEEGALVHTAQGFKVLRFNIETKTIPGSGFKLKLAERCAAIAKEQQFDVGRKQKKEITEQLRDELLPKVVAARKSVMVLIDVAERHVIIDASSSKDIEPILVSIFRHADIELDSLALGTALTDMAKDEDLAPFTADDRISLDDGTTEIIYRQVQVDAVPIAGKFRVSALALTHDDAVSFQLHSNGLIRSLAPTSIYKQAARDAADFDASVVLAGLALRKLINDLQTKESEYAQ